MVKKRGRPKKEIKPEVSGIKPIDKKDERQAFRKKLLADHRLPTEEEYKTGGRDILRYTSEFNHDYGADMARLGVGFTSLMKEKSAKG